MKRIKPLYIILAIIILSVSILAVSAIADAGNFSGGSDYGGGGGGWSGGGSSDWGGSGGGDFYYIGGGSGGGVSVLWIVGILFFLFFTFMIIKRKGAGSASVSTGVPVAPVNLQPISSLRDKDPNFSEAAVKENIANLYVRMQNAWQAKDFEPMRPYMTDSLYNQFARQLDELIRAKQTNFIEHIAVLDVTINGWSEDESNDSIVATVTTRINDYNVDDNTGRVVSGSKTAEKFMTYQWTLIRSKGMITPERAGEGSEQTVTVHCPSCGAPTNINQSAKCEYCGSIINAKDYDWAISAIKGISQQTRGN